MKGKVSLYGKDNINTDEIISAKYLNLDKEKELAKHAFEDFDPSLVGKAGRGDILVAGKNFGCGSSREHAVWALRGVGIKAVIASSLARIFYRNCINNGLLAIECPEIEKKIEEGDELEIKLKKGKVKNLTRNEEYSFSPLPEFIIEIVNQGGLLKYIKQKQKDG